MSVRQIAIPLLLCLSALAQEAGVPRIQTVVNAADFWYPVVAVGGLGTVFGERFSVDEHFADSLPLPVKLGETELLVCPATSDLGDCRPLPLSYVGPNQINFLLDLSNLEIESIVRPLDRIAVRRSGVLDEEALAGQMYRTRFEVIAPGIFTVGYDCSFDARFPDDSPCGLSQEQLGKNHMLRGAVTDSPGRLLASDNPARVGPTYTIWMTGLGRASEGKPDHETTVLVDRIPVFGFEGSTWRRVPPSFAGPSPEFAGLYQVNFRFSDSLLGPFPWHREERFPYPPPHPCGRYMLELVIAVGQTSVVPPRVDRSSGVAVPVLIEEGDVDCGED